MAGHIKKPTTVPHLHSKVAPPATPAKEPPMVTKVTLPPHKVGRA